MDNIYGIISTHFCHKLMHYWDQKNIDDILFLL